LKKMIEYERMAFNDKEPFEFYLSAFLNAGRTVDYRLRHEQEAIYTTWRNAWDATLTQEQQGLIKFMVKERNDEVHRSGSSHTVGTENRELGPGVHTLASGTHTVAGPPDIYPLAIIRTPAYYFSGTERKATEACERYLAVLKRMVEDFKAQPR
jgi:hypothetical protein